MILYLVKAVLCSSLFYIFYFIILEREKFHVFNRFYLIGSILASFVIPIIRIKTKIATIPIVETVNLPYYNIQNSLPQQSIANANNFDYLPYLILLIYLIVSGALLYRFIKNLIQLYSRTRTNKSIIYSGVKLILVKENIIPYSFLNYVFVNNESYENGTLERELLHHEIAHVKQRHSLDIILIELLTILIWFNPLVYFFKRSIQLNHEFLADDSVIKAFNNTQSYQYLLVNKASSQNRIQLTSSFNFRITKKRIIMMTKSTSLKVASLKIMAIIPVAAIVVFLFSIKVYAQESISKFQQSTNENKQQNILEEYNIILSKYKLKETGSYGGFFKDITDSDKKRLEFLYLKMTKEEKEKQIVAFIPSGPPLKKIMPTQEQLNDFKNPKLYGVWIDEKKVNNSELNKYNSSDFSNVFISRLLPNAKKNATYDFQVDLMTNAFYQKYYDEAIANKDKLQMVIMYKTNQPK